MNSIRAEAMALEALGWLAADPERAGAFLDAAGASPGDLRERARDPAFLGFVLDHVLSEDAFVRAFAEEADHAPEDVLRARRALPGGDAPEWT
jgi:hypothetical protein